MAKKYKIWIRHGEKYGWLMLDENGTSYYVDYEAGSVFNQNAMREYMRGVEKARLKNLDVRPHRYKESKNEQ